MQRLFAVWGALVRALGSISLGLFFTILVLPGPQDARAAVIFVTTLEQKISDTGGCSLQEAIASANWDDNVAISSYGYWYRPEPEFVETGCVPGNGADVIVLPGNAVFLLKRIVDDDGNPFGPTATPLVWSDVTIEGNGATLQFVPSERKYGHWFHPETVPVYFRAFAVGDAGSLTIRNAHIRGFVTHGGNGGYISDLELGGNGSDENGGGGGMGAGGAVYVRNGTLVVEASAFEGNGAIGGEGAGSLGEIGGGGGGGLGGWGGPASCGSDGGGGGGSRGYGIGSCAGDGGGTVFDAENGTPGFRCGGYSGWRGAGEGGATDDGEDAPCDGGGGGAGGSGTSGGRGAYGGGGGGGHGGGRGGHGGFGGGGGGGAAGILFGASGGNGGFGGGGGAGPNSIVTDGTPGRGGMFGGNGNHRNGGGGAALGGAIFNDSGTIVVRNSTFTGNFVSRGNGGGAPNPGQAQNGADGGSAIFSRNGRLTIQNSTIAGNEATGYGGGVVVAEDGGPISFTLHNTIIANNGADECSLVGSVTNTDFRNNLIEDNDGCGISVSSGDARLGPLQDNQGPTPTMAILRTSPAFNAADAEVAAPTDQRGQERPALGAFDIGAFELCTTGLLEQPCLILDGVGTVETRELTIAVTPAGGGTTTPAPGTSEHRLNSVVLLNATPSASYRFANWTGAGVADPGSASTAIPMSEDRSIAANFELFDFNLSAIPPLVVPVGGSGATTVTVNSVGVFAEPVLLGALNRPAATIASFSPFSVTPAAGGAANSQLTIALGVSAQPGTYSVDISGTGGGLTRSTPLQLTIAATPDGIVEVINELTALGCVDSAGVSNAFTTKLAQAEAAIDAGDAQTAINILMALLRQLQAQAGKHLATTCTDGNGVTFNPVDLLITHVDSLLASLGAGARANPIVGSVLDSSLAEVPGAIVSILRGKTIVDSAKTDATGFYFFARTRGLEAGTGYTAKVALPKGYKNSSPAFQTFKWDGAEITLNSFVLY